MKTSALKLEINQTMIPPHVFKGNLICTPPIDEKYWMFRVPLSDDQAVVAFPKFCTIGIGFQHETNWNTNLPFQTDAERIFQHIKENKGDDRIPDSEVKAAIKILQKACQEFDPEKN